MTTTFISSHDIARTLRRRLYQCAGWEKKILFALASDLGIEIDPARVARKRLAFWARRKAIHSKQRAKQHGLTTHFTGGQFLKLGDYYGWQCIHCGTKNKLTVEHIQPMGHGGSNAIDNIAITCVSCNQARGQLGLSEDPRTHWPLWFKNVCGQEGES